MFRTTCICPDGQLSSPLNNLDNEISIVVLRHFALDKDKFICILSAHHRIDKINYWHFVLSNDKFMCILSARDLLLRVYYCSSYRHKQLRRRGIVFFKQHDLTVNIYKSLTHNNWNLTITTSGGAWDGPVHQGKSWTPCYVSLRSLIGWWQLSVSITQE